ncbi:unnamed protein product [Aphanomyces euteiches]
MSETKTSASYQDRPKSDAYRPNTRGHHKSWIDGVEVPDPFPSEVPPQDLKDFDRQWDCRFNIPSEDYLMMLVAAIQEHYAEGKKRYVLVSGVEIGTKPQHTDYQSSGAIMKKWGIDMKLGPRNRALPYKGWRDHHIKEFSKKHPNIGRLPDDLKRTGTPLRSEAEKKCKVNDVIIDMRSLIEAGKEKEAFEKYPRNFMQYGEKLKAMVSQHKKTFFGKHLDPHVPPGSGKTSLLKFLYPRTYKKYLSNRFWDLYDENQFAHVMLEDLDSPTLDRLSIQWLKTICDGAGFAIDQKYKTPQLTCATILVISNQTINQLIDGLDETACIEDTKRAIRRRFFQLQIDDLLKIVGLALIPEYERKQLKKQGNEDPSKLFMNWS